MASKKKTKIQTFQDTIFTLQKFWANHGCVILQPYDLEVGHGSNSIYLFSKNGWHGL